MGPHACGRHRVWLTARPMSAQDHDLQQLDVQLLSRCLKDMPQQQSNQKFAATEQSRGSSATAELSPAYSQASHDSKNDFIVMDDDTSNCTQKGAIPQEILRHLETRGETLPGPLGYQHMDEFVCVHQAFRASLESHVPPCPDECSYDSSIQPGSSLQTSSEWTLPDALDDADLTEEPY